VSQPTSPSPIRKLIEDSLSGILVAGVVAFGTMTYQFAQMRVEIESLRRDVTKVESMVSALMTRQSFYYGDDEAVEIARIARAIENARNPGVNLIAPAAAQEK
jgi:hypothetical protein